MTYDNKFASSSDSVKEVQIAAEDYVIYGVSSASNQPLKICTVVDSSGNMISNYGTVLLDSSNNSIAVSFLTKEKKTVEFTCTEFKYEELYLGTSADDAQLDITRFIIPATNTKPVGYTSYQQATQKLCELYQFSYQDVREEVRAFLSKELFYVLGLGRADNLFAYRALQACSYALNLPEQSDATKQCNNFTNFAVVLNLLNGLTGSPYSISSREWTLEEVRNLVADCLSSCYFSVDQLCEVLDEQDANLVALHMLCKESVNRQGYRTVYDALLNIPEIASRLINIENRCIVMYVMNEIRDDVLSLFARGKKTVKDIYMYAVTPNTLGNFSEKLVGRFSKVLREKPFYVTSKILSEKFSAVDSVLKYFILEQDTYEFIKTLMEDDVDSSYSEFVLDELQLSRNSLKELLTSRDLFVSSVGIDYVETFFFRHKDFCDQVVMRGLANVVVSNKLSQVVKSFDIFNSIYPVLLGELMQDEFVSTESYEKEFYQYSGSYCISNCCVCGEAVMCIAGGQNRAEVYHQYPEDFVWDDNIGDISKYNLVDLNSVD